MSDIEQVFGDDGLVAQKFPLYQKREQQIVVSNAIADNMTSKGVLLAEASCGTGKSMAYLVPAFQKAMAFGDVTIISTHTLSLQDQLMSKDIPLVLSLFGEEGKNVKIAQMKGRGNYLCNVALDNARGDMILSSDPLFIKVSKWAAKTKTGDKAELPTQYSGWEDLTSTTDSCAKQKCPLYNSCHYYTQKRKVMAAQIIVVNHALFFADLKQRSAMLDEEGVIKVKSTLLPDYHHAVLDEAHHIEDVATSAFGQQTHNRRMPKLLDKLKKLRVVDQWELDAARTVNDKLFGIYENMERGDFILNKGPYEEELLRKFRSQINIITGKLGKEAKEMQDNGESEASIHPIKSGATGLTRAFGEINDIFWAAAENNVKWGSTSVVGHKKYKKVEINLTPINVAPHLQCKLWEICAGLISITLISATLATNNTFQYLKNRLGIGKCSEVIVGSPFNFKSNALFYVPAHLPEPERTPSQSYTHLVCAEMKRLLELTSGRAFLLFTSKAMMNNVGAYLKEQTAHPLFIQGEMGNGALLDLFRSTEGAVLLGVASFWEGVDVQGEQLSLVVIDRIPFSVPDSPIQRAKMASVESKGGSGFSDYSIPCAILKLKQGFGRLIRTSTDRGIIVCLDTRLLTKKYGTRIVSSLPPASKASKWGTVEKFWKGEG